MATNPPKGAGRKGSVKGRAQVLNPRNNRYTKIDTATGKFIDQFAKPGQPFKGVRKKK
jgi:hypothetical protein